MNYVRKTTWVAFSTCDSNGQVTNGFALEVFSLELNGFTDQGVQFDLHHLDDEHERLILTCKPYDVFALNKLEFVVGVRVTGEFPASMPISKDEFRKRVGTGKLLNKARGHYE